MEVRTYIGWETPGPLPPHTPGQGALCKFKKKYIKVLSLCLGDRTPVAHGAMTRGYFRNFSKRTYIFEIFIFFKYKKEKDALQRLPKIISVHKFVGRGPS